MRTLIRWMRIGGWIAVGMIVVGFLAMSVASGS